MPIGSPVGVPRTSQPGVVPEIGSSPGGSKPTIVQSMGAGANSGSLANNAFITNVPAAVGDFVLVSFSWAIASQTISSCSDTQGNAWTIVNHPAASSQSGGYCYTTVTVGWASTNTVTATLSSTGGGREVAGCKIPAAYSPVVDQHNEGTATGNVVATLAGALAQQNEVIIISDLVRATGASTIPVWSWNAGFQDVAHAGGSGTLDAGVAIGSFDNIAGTAPVTGGFISATTTDPHGWGILAVKVTYPASGTTFPITIIVGTVSLVASVKILDKLNIVASTVTTPVTIVRQGLLNILPTVSTPVTVQRKGLLNIVTSTVTLPVTVAVQLVKLITIVTGTVSLSASVQRLGKLNILPTVSTPVTLIRKGLLNIKPTVAPTATVQRKGLLNITTGTVSTPATVQRKGLLGIVASTLTLPVTLVRKGLLLIKPTVTATATDSLVFIAGSTGTPGIIYMNITVIGESANSSLITGVDP